MKTLSCLAGVSGLFCAIGALLLLESCASAPKIPEEGPEPPPRLREVPFSRLPGWGDDRAGEALAAFRISCTNRILKVPPDKLFGPEHIPDGARTYGDWQPACRAAIGTALQNTDSARRFFEHYFRPAEIISARTGTDGLFTGYYEPLLRGARTRFGPYQTPLLRRPADLVEVDLGAFRDSLKGERIAGRVENGRLIPYEDRADIAAGALAARLKHDSDSNSAAALVYVDDPIDAFFLHIQGSGRIDLAGGGSMRAGYDGQNGHVYYAIGRELIARGELTKENVSLQTIRAWLNAHPDAAQDLMNLNPSYIFFRELEGPGPLGAEGVPLTPGRSLAVDRTMIPYGAPVYIATGAPEEGEAPVRRLLIAQDTGGAIRGAVRGDVFWGYGPRAEYLAGHMKAPGRAWVLLPK